jgi:hypothetical protein
MANPCMLHAGVIEPLRVGFVISLSVGCCIRIVFPDKGLTMNRLFRLGALVSFGVGSIALSWLRVHHALVHAALQNDR